MSLSFSTMAAIRFGYGLRPGEKPQQNKDDLLQQMMSAGDRPLMFPVGGIDKRRQEAVAFQDKIREIRKSDADAADKQKQQKLVRLRAGQAFRTDTDSRLMQAVVSPLGFHERLATFWTNHFSVSANKNPGMRLPVPLYEAEAIRPNIGGSFADLLTSATAHPAMLIYLDQAQSQGPDSLDGMRRQKGLNENLGRELLELHTLGAGSGYTQSDVRSAALVLTGVTVDYQAYDAVFRPRMAEPGPHQVLGVSYGGEQRRPGDYREMLDDLAVNPKTAEHISRKLAVHFIADTPPDDMIRAMVAEWKRTHGDLMAIYAAMLDHPDAWRNEGAKARQPFDYVVAGLRAFNIGNGEGMVEKFFDDHPETDSTDIAPSDMKAVDDMAPAASMTTQDQAQIRTQRKALQTARALGSNALRRMGQPTWLPPSPAGFEEGFSSWITASQLSERLAWARRASTQFGEDLDPREFLKSTLADAARADTIQVVSQAPNKIAGLTMVLASPEFNRR